MLLNPGGVNPPTSITGWKELVKMAPLGALSFGVYTVFKIQLTVTLKHSASICKLRGRDLPLLLCCGSAEVHSRLPLLLKQS